MELNIIRFWKR